MGERAQAVAAEFNRQSHGDLPADEYAELLAQFAADFREARAADAREANRRTDEEAPETPSAAPEPPDPVPEPSTARETPSAADPVASLPMPQDAREAWQQATELLLAAINLEDGLINARVDRFESNSSLLRPVASAPAWLDRGGLIRAARDMAATTSVGAIWSPPD
jgi:hypothetical protein